MMIVCALSFFLTTASAPAAKADTDFTLVWTYGESSRDAMRDESTWTLAGNELSQTNRRSGQGAEPLMVQAPRQATLDRAQLRAIAKGLATLDAIKVKAPSKRQKAHDGPSTSIHLEHGKHVVDLLFPYNVDADRGPHRGEPPAKIDALARLTAFEAALFDLVPMFPPEPTARR